MQRFADREKRTWDIVINVSQIKKVRNLLKVDLYKLVEDGMKPLAELLADPVLFVDLVYVLCEQQARDAGVSDEDFGRAMAGDALNAAGEAFVAELVDFFPEAQQRETLRLIRKKGRELATKIHQEQIQRINTLDVSEMAKTMVPNGSSTVAPESSASTPDR